MRSRGWKKIWKHVSVQDGRTSGKRRAERDIKRGQGRVDISAQGHIQYGGSVKVHVNLGTGNGLLMLVLIWLKYSRNVGICCRFPSKHVFVFLMKNWFRCYGDRPGDMHQGLLSGLTHLRSFYSFYSKGMLRRFSGSLFADAPFKVGHTERN